MGTILDTMYARCSPGAALAANINEWPTVVAGGMVQRALVPMLMAMPERDVLAFFERHILDLVQLVRKNTRLTCLNLPTLS